MLLLTKINRMNDKNKTDVTINKKVEDCTIKCDKYFKCLSQSNHELCKVTESVKDEVFFIECLEKMNCAYLVSFGTFHTCNCPTRKEIYRVHKI